MVFDFFTVSSPDRVKFKGFTINELSILDIYLNVEISNDSKET